MSKTQHYRDQHQELTAMVGQLQIFLDPGNLAKDASEPRHLLSLFAAKLNMHLALEDKALYPQLLKHKDSAVQAKAKRFMDEMGSIKEAFGAYMGKYPSAQAIQAAPAAFITDSNGLIKVLAKRIHSEDSDLYALVDQIG